MTVEQMRSAIADVYFGPIWKAKVARMPDYQVMAIYFRFEKEGQFNQSKPVKKKECGVEQITIDQWMKENKMKGMN